MSCCGGVQVGIENVPADLKPKMGRAAIVRHCDVCFLLDNDIQPKEVRYCSLCDKFMCEPCRRSPWRRLWAKVAMHTRTLKTVKGN